MALTAFQANAFQLDAFQIEVVTASIGGAFGPPEPKKHKRTSKRERERLLDQALAKAFDTKQTPIIDRMPWLAEPIPEAIRLKEPEFNPVLASLHGDMANLQAQLAQLQFNRAQEEADIELLLMAL